MTALKNYKLKKEMHSCCNGIFWRSDSC